MLATAAPLLLMVPGVGHALQCKMVTGQTVVAATGSPFTLASSGCVERTASAPSQAPLSPLLQLYERPNASADVVLHQRRPSSSHSTRTARASVRTARVAAPARAPSPPAPRLIQAPRPRTAKTIETNYSGPRPLPRGAAYAPAVLAVARAYNIDPALMGAVARRESGLNPAARSPKGAVGIMQLMPTTASRFGAAPNAIANPVVNLSLGAVYLKSLQRRYGNNLPLILSAYNAGEGAVDRHGRRIPPYRETQAYVAGILADYAGALHRRQTTFR